MPPLGPPVQPDTTDERQEAEVTSEPSEGATTVIPNVVGGPASGTETSEAVTAAEGTGAEGTAGGEAVPLADQVSLQPSTWSEAMAQPTLPAPSHGPSPNLAISTMLASGMVDQVAKGLAEELFGGARLPVNATGASMISTPGLADPGPSTQPLPQTPSKTSAIGEASSTIAAEAETPPPLQPEIASSFGAANSPIPSCPPPDGSIGSDGSSGPPNLSPATAYGLQPEPVAQINQPSVSPTLDSVPTPVPTGPTTIQPHAPLSPPSSMGEHPEVAGMTAVAALTQPQQLPIQIFCTTLILNSLPGGALQVAEALAAQAAAAMPSSAPGAPSIPGANSSATEANETRTEHHMQTSARCTHIHFCATSSSLVTISGFNCHAMSLCCWKHILTSMI